MSAQVFHVEVYEDGGAYVMMRVVGNAGTNITVATMSRLDYSIVNMVTGATVTALTQLTPLSTYIFDTLQTDARWTKDATGYNVAFTIPAGTLSTSDTLYGFNFKFTPTSGEVFNQPVEILTRKLWAA